MSTLGVVNGRSHWVWPAIAAVAVCAACTENPSASSPSSSSSTRPGADTADAVIRALTQEGLDPLHPVDTTKQDCPSAGCAQEITTDRLRIMSFATSGAAQVYAADHKAEQVETVVVTFAPNLPSADRDKYWSAITRIMS